MSAVRVELIAWGVSPGAAIQGKVSWNCREFDSPEVEIRLFWQTAGKGDKDRGAPLEARFPVTPGEGELLFSMVAPNGPCSFSGKLLSIVWTLEAVVGKRGVQVPVVIGPGGREVVVSNEAS